MRLQRTGQLIFAIAFICLSAQGMLMHDFNFGRPPAWSDNLARTMWSYVGGVVVTIAGIAVITRRYASQATLIAGLIILLSIFLIRNIPDLFSKDLSSAFLSLNAFKTLALAGGCFVVSVSLRKEGDRFSKILLWFGAISLAYFLFLCGIAHFKFIGFITGGFIPTYIPFQNFWTYLTGTCLILGGAGLLVKPVRRLAALMSGIMILGWFFLLHIPRVLAAPSDYLEWFGVFESFGFVGILFVLSSLFYKSEVVSVPRQL